jgi:hypothetical protein
LFARVLCVISCSSIQTAQEQHIINKCVRDGGIMKQILMSIVAIFFPWLVLVLDDNPGGAFIALIMQATIIGWPFATVWAWRIIHPPKKN